MEPLAQLGPEALVRSEGSNTWYLPSEVTYRYGTSRATGVVASVVIGGFGNDCAGAPFTPAKTMFQTEPFQEPKLESWLYHCCCDAEATWPETLVSEM